MIKIHLYGKLRRFTCNLNPRGKSILEMAVNEGDTIEDVINSIGIPHEEVGLNVFLNGEYSKTTRTVSDGDRLGIFPDDMQLLYKWYFTKKGD